MRAEISRDAIGATKKEPFVHGSAPRLRISDLAWFLRKKRDRLYRRVCVTRIENFWHYVRYNVFTLRASE